MPRSIGRTRGLQSPGDFLSPPSQQRISTIVHEPVRSLLNAFCYSVPIEVDVVNRAHDIAPGSEYTAATCASGPSPSCIARSVEMLISSLRGAGRPCGCAVNSCSIFLGAPIGFVITCARGLRRVREADRA